MRNQIIGMLSEWALAAFVFGLALFLTALIVLASGS